MNKTGNVQVVSGFDYVQLEAFGLHPWCPMSRPISIELEGINPTPFETELSQYAGILRLQQLAGRPVGVNELVAKMIGEQFPWDSGLNRLQEYCAEGIEDAHKIALGMGPTRQGETDGES